MNVSRRWYDFPLVLFEGSRNNGRMVVKEYKHFILIIMCTDYRTFSLRPTHPYSHSFLISELITEYGLYVNDAFWVHGDACDR